VAPAPEDLVISLGDYVDRGPASAAVLDRLIALRQAAHLVALRGNHEEMMLNARRGGGHAARQWLAYGGNATLASYGLEPAVESVRLIPARHWAFIERDCIDFFETERHFFVHANADPALPIAAQDSAFLRWEELEQVRPHCSGKVMVCGHARLESGVPLDLGSAICIDTGAYAGGWLTCLDVEAGAVWQANERGETRAFPLARGPG
jgi:serine/threonine protein phosphatase 1